VSTPHPHRRRAVLLLNTGSPAAPTPRALRQYLRRFLGDPRVVDLPWLVRVVLVEAVIAPARAFRSARRYRDIWTPQGSPLDLYTAAQAEGLRSRLRGVSVAYAMRYGAPSIESVIAAFEREAITEIVVLPMFPQYASATVGAAVTEVYRCVGRMSFVPSVHVVPPFFVDDGYLDAVAARITETLAEARADQLLLSYHGLPVRQLSASTRVTGGRCELGECCATLRPDNHACYRAQCFATSRALARRLPPGLVTATVFQSRISGTEWCGPHLEDRILELARSGVRRLAVALPGFLADNLETLHDVAIDAREAFIAAGGEALIAVPCVNDDRRWLDALAHLVRREFEITSEEPAPLEA
jgi:ferrochelatase